MDINEVPFAAHNGIVIEKDNTLTLPFDATIQNHLAGVHAGAQFLLAESASGYYLLTAFPHLRGKINPLLRESKIKFHQQTQSRLTAQVLVAEQAVEKWLKSLENRGRGAINLQVEITDQDNLITCEGEFRWFVQLNA